MTHRMSSIALTRAQVWSFGAPERTRPLQQYLAAFPKRDAFRGRVHALEAGLGPDGPVAVVRALGVTAV